MRLLFFLIACACLAAPRFTQEPAIQPNPNSAVPLAAVLSFRADTPVSTVIEISDGNNRSTLEYGPEHDASKGLPVVGMRPDRKHTVRITIRDAQGAKTTAEPLTFATPPLPKGEGEFPPIHITVRKPARMEPGFTLFSPRRQKDNAPKFGATFGMLVAVDDAGEPVWFYRTGSRISDVEPLGNGHILFLTQDYRVVEIDMLGNTVKQWYASRRPDVPAANATPVDTTTFHHEIDELPNGNLVVLGSEVREIDNWYTSETDPNAPRKRQKVMGDEIVEFTRDGKVVWRWNAFDYLPVERLAYETFSGYWERRGFPDVKDWSHANGLMYDPKDDSLLVNFRYQSATVKIDRKTKEIKWIAAPDEKWPAEHRSKLLKLEGNGRWFYHQHAPHPTPRGTLLIFDNGNYQTMPFDKPKPPRETYSRAVEYAIDEKRKTARQVWESEKNGPDSVVSIAMGDVDHMPKTGNILVHYGALADPVEVKKGADWEGVFGGGSAWSQIREYAGNELVWEAVIGEKTGNSPVAWVLFGGDRVASLVPPPKKK